MKTLILYSTKCGTTEECARILADKLGNDAGVISIKDMINEEIAKYDMIILGTPVYAGKILPEVKTFCESNYSFLKEKRVALFFCGMDDEAKALKSIQSLFPKDILDIAAAKAYFGGKFIFENMNAMEKMIIQKMTGLKDNVDKLLKNRIEEFADLLNSNVCQ